MAQNGSNAAAAGGGGGGGPVMTVPFYDPTEGGRYDKWKNHVPLLYDTLCPSHFSWGTLSASFGPAIWEPSPGVTDNQENYYQRFLYAPRTGKCYSTTYSGRFFFNFYWSPHFVQMRHMTQNEDAGMELPVA